MTNTDVNTRTAAVWFDGVDHPGWCDRRICQSETQRDGTVLVVHQLVLLDDDRGGVQVRQAVEHPPGGGVPTSERVVVVVETAAELSAEQALAVAGVIGAAAGYARGLLRRGPR